MKRELMARERQLINERRTCKPTAQRLVNEIVEGKLNEAHGDEQIESVNLFMEDVIKQATSVQDIVKAYISGGGDGFMHDKGVMYKSNDANVIIAELFGKIQGSLTKAMDAMKRYDITSME